MKETLQQRIESLIDKLQAKEDYLFKTIAEEAGKEHYAEASRLQTRLSVVRDILADLEKTLR